MTAGETAMQTFTFHASATAIRVDLVDGEPWFVAKDVCRALNITWNGKTLDQIPEGWKGKRKLLTPGGTQEFTCITEAAMYKLAFRCQTSEVADNFTNWVVADVLPSIRRTGGYMMPGLQPRPLCSGYVKPRITAVQ